MFPIQKNVLYNILKVYQNPVRGKHRNRSQVHQLLLYMVNYYFLTTPTGVKTTNTLWETTDTLWETTTQLTLVPCHDPHVLFLNMEASEICEFCNQPCEEAPSTTLTGKGCRGINKAYATRKDGICCVPGQQVHLQCWQIYCHPSEISKASNEAK